MKKEKRTKQMTPKRWMIRCIVIVLCFVFFLLTFGAIVENHTEGIETRNFTQSPALDTLHSTEETKYYMVDQSEEASSGTFDSEGNFIAGKPGDIIISLPSPYQGIPFLDEFVSYYIGGHAAIVGKKGIYEIFGNSSGEHRVALHDNYIADKNAEIYLLRTKLTEEQINDLLEETEKQLGKKYNYFPFISFKNKYYCSDLVSRMFKTQGLNLNKDGGITTIHDLFFSSDTEIVYYQVYKWNVKYIYYIPESIEL